MKEGIVEKKGRGRSTREKEGASKQNERMENEAGLSKEKLCWNVFCAFQLKKDEKKMKRKEKLQQQNIKSTKTLAESCPVHMKSINSP